MPDIRPAELVRRVEPGENWQDVVDEAKSETWTHKREHALVITETGQHLLVRGGDDGIAFQVQANGAVTLTIDGLAVRIRTLAWHTHPEPTGPSDYDREFLKALNQTESVIFEIRGDPKGTRFRATDPTEARQ